MIFRTIDDASEFSGKKISNIFSELKGLDNIQFSIDQSYASGLKADIADLVALKHKLGSTPLTKENARLFMPNSSQNAINFALSDEFKGLDKDGITAKFTEKQDQLYFKNLAVGKSFKDCQTIISAYNQSIDAANGKTKDLIEGTSQSNLHLGQYLNSLNGAKASFGGYVKSLALATAETALLNAATIALNVALTTIVSYGIQKLARGFTSIVDALVVTAEEVEDAFTVFDSAKQDVETICSELKGIGTQIDALNAKKGLTLVEKGQLNDLEKAKELAEIQLKIAERQEQKAAIEALNTLFKQYKDEYGKTGETVNKQSVDEAKEMLSMGYAGGEAEDPVVYTAARLENYEKDVQDAESALRNTPLVHLSLI